MSTTQTIQIKRTSGSSVGSAVNAGELNYVEGANDLYIGNLSQTAWNPLCGDGIHRARTQLVHNDSDSGEVEYLYSGNALTNKIIWTDGTKTIKRREFVYTYLNNRINTSATIQYDDLGVVITGETETITYTYSGNKVISATKVRT